MSLTLYVLHNIFDNFMKFCVNILQITPRVVCEDEVVYSAIKYQSYNANCRIQIVWKHILKKLFGVSITSVLKWELVYFWMKSYKLCHWMLPNVFIMDPAL